MDNTQFMVANLHETDDKPLELLMAELQRCWDEDRDVRSQMVQTITVTVAALTILFATGTSSDSSGEDFIRGLIALALLIAGFSHVCALGLLSQLRYKHIRYLEKCIRELIGFDESLSWTEISAAVHSLNPAHVYNRYAITHFLYITATVVGIAVGCVLLFLLSMRFSENPDLVVFFVFLGVFPFVLFVTYSYCAGNARAEDMYQASRDVARKKRKAYEDRAFGSSKESDGSNLVKMALYLLYPRPLDAVKDIFIILGCILGSAILRFGSGDSDLWELFARSVMTVFSFDCLAYQARYQLNDIKGSAQDDDNPQAALRGRLPHVMGKIEIARKISLVVLLYRIAFLITLISVNAMDMGSPLLACSLALLLITLIYEWAREKKKTLLVYGFVSLGYPLRIAAGACCVNPGIVEALVNEGLILSVVLMLLSSIPFGVAFVGMTWALEGADKMRIASLSQRHAGSSKDSASQYGKDGKLMAIRKDLKTSKPHVFWSANLMGKDAYLDEFPLVQNRRLSTPWFMGQLLAVALLVMAYWNSGALWFCAVAFLMYVWGLLWLFERFAKRKDACWLPCVILLFAGFIISSISLAKASLPTSFLHYFILVLLHGYILIYVYFTKKNYQQMASFIKEIIGKIGYWFDLLKKWLLTPYGEL